MAFVIWLLPGAFNSFLIASEANKFTITVLMEVLSRATFFLKKKKKGGGGLHHLISLMSDSW